MGEQTLTFYVLVPLALLLTVGGIFILRQRSRERAQRIREIRRQQFASKQAAIAEELASKLQRDKPVNAAQHSAEKLTPLKQNVDEIKQEPAPQTIKNPQSPPSRSPHAKSPPVNSPQVTLSQAAPPRDQATSQQPQVKINHPSAKMSVRPQGQTTSYTKEQPSQPRPPLQPQPPNPALAQKLAPHRRGASIVPSEFRVNNNQSLHLQIASYAKWVAKQSHEFVLEQYENDVKTGHVHLLFDEAHLERMNGHWIDLFRPLDVDLIRNAIKTQGNSLFCKFSDEALERIRQPASDILARVAAEDSKRNEQIIKECGLAEFCEYLEDLQFLTTEPKQKTA